MSLTPRLDEVEVLLLPPGCVIPYAGPIAPAGWALCDGTTLDRITHSRLFEVIGTSFGEGDGSTTFHLPDLRGRFIRGADAGAGRDPNVGTRTASNTGGNTGDNVGSIQSDAVDAHNHSYQTPITAAVTGIGYGQISVANHRMATVDDNQIANRSTGSNTGTETRPININMNYIMKV